jgi:uncharacterized protein YidB (DUF937 family)
MSPLIWLLLGVLAYRTYKGKGRLAEMLGQAAPAGANPSGGNVAGPAGNLAPPSSGGLGDLFRGGLAGGAAGGLLAGGLGEMLNRFQQNGYGDVANSWIGTGPNRAVSPDQLQQALGPDTVNSLAEQAGVSQIDLLSGLSRDLPDAVDQFTPEGRIPEA